MSDRINVGSLNVDRELYAFVNEQALPGTALLKTSFGLTLKHL